MEPSNKEKESSGVEKTASTKTAHSTEAYKEPHSDRSSEGALNREEDISEHRLWAVLGYIIPILFFIPLQDDKSKNVPYVRFHANQQLIILVAWLVVYVLNSVLFGVLPMMILPLTATLLSIVHLAVFVLSVIGAVNAYNGKMKELPLIGHFKLLK